MKKKPITCSKPKIKLKKATACFKGTYTKPKGKAKGTILGTLTISGIAPNGKRVIRTYIYRKNGTTVKIGAKDLAFRKKGVKAKRRK